VVASACAAGLFFELYTSAEGQSFYDDISADFVYNIPVSHSSTSNKVIGTTSTSPTVAAVTTEEEGPEELPEQIAPTPSAPIIPDFGQLTGSLPDIIGWIRNPGASIDYPVMQGEDNDYYLRRLPNGKNNQIGSIFIDYRNAADFSDKNTLIYGHYTRQGYMFGSLSKYKKPAYYRGHPFMLLYTPEADYMVELFAGYLLDPEQENPQIYFDDETEFNDYISGLRERSVFQSEVEVGSEDRLLTLCTCDYSFTNARFVLVGRLCEIY
jgi:sortase B